MRPIRDLITGREVVSLREDATALDAARSMTAQKVGCVMVTDAAGAPRGIFTERDLMTRVTVEGRDPGGVTLSEVMTRDLYTCEPTLRLQAVREEMSKRHIRHLPVVESGKLLAVLSLRDILRADLEVHAKDLEAMTAYIQGENESGQVPPRA